MKSIQSFGAAFSSFSLIVVGSSLCVSLAGAAPAVRFTPLADGQTVSDLTALRGHFSGSVTSVIVSIHELDPNGGQGRWWNGTGFQTTAVDLATTLSGTNWSPAATVALPALNSGQTYALAATAKDTANSTATAAISVQATTTVLAWDPGTTPGGTVLLANPNTNGGNYVFRISPLSPSVGVWRTALNVQAGQATVYARRGAAPTTGLYDYGSQRAGSNGFVIDGSRFNPGEDWYVLVNAASSVARWTLVSGEAYVHDLGSLASDTSSGTNAVIRAEGMLFFKTVIPPDTLAWRLWLNGAANQMFVRKSLAPTESGNDLFQAGQMLVVPPYLAGSAFNGAYYIGVTGAPGTAIALDSRRQAITDLAFNSATQVAVSANEYPYRTFRVQVPVQQLAWQANLTPTSGQPNLAVRRGAVPNEFRNDAFSEPPANVGASVALVPPPQNQTLGLSDGTYLLTVYSTGAFACGLTNGNPVVTDLHYTFNVTNDVPNRAGWRYYRVANINEQLGSLGWQLFLSNQPPGAKIALRRNAVPGQWSYRDMDNYTTYYPYTPRSQQYLDLSGTTGFLQQPGHQADIWYLGVFTDQTALGRFVLSGGELTSRPVAFDGAGSSLSVTNSPAGKWDYFRFTVPTDALGWDIRLSASAGNPQMVVCRDALPNGLSTSPGWFYAGSSTLSGSPHMAIDWLSGNQWLAGPDWSKLGGGPLLAIGMTNPLVPGTYYVGVQDPDAASSYTLQSRGIGRAGTSILVRDLDFAAGTNTGSLAVGQADYYRVVVPSNAPNWKLQLTALSGELLLKVQSQYLPNCQGDDGYGALFGSLTGEVIPARGGQKMMKPGDEQWLLLPNNGQTCLWPGLYYVAVSSQGLNTTNGYTPGTATYRLTSRVEPLASLTGSLSYGNDLLFTNSQAGGEVKLYQFTAPAGLASLEVRLESKTGNPTLYLAAGTNAVGTASGLDHYGHYGGTNALANSDSLITVPNPAGPYSLSVVASALAPGSTIFPNASYVIRVHAVPPPSLAFDGGRLSVTNQLPGEWRFFRVDVPADALGWDVRLVEASTAGATTVVVSRDTLPTQSGTLWWADGSYGDPTSSDHWASGNQWAGWSDWAGCYGRPVLTMAMGRPLEPGTYYVGVPPSSYTNSFTVLSRGIGPGHSLVVRDLDFATGIATGPALSVGEADYYRVQVPSNAPNWKLKLRSTSGDTFFKVRRSFLPITQGANDAWALDSYGGGGRLMLQAGDEQWALLPESSSNIVAGTYYLLVASQGQNPDYASSCPEGTGSANYQLASGIEPLLKPAAVLNYGTDLLLTNTVQKGELRFYQFTVAPGLTAFTVGVESGSGDLSLNLAPGPLLCGVLNHATAYDHYGYLGGVQPQVCAPHQATLANPPAGPYSLSVYGESDASFVLRVHAVPPTALAFDGGSATVTSQPAGQWRFFQVTVPADALGWDVRLVGDLTEDTRFVVSRGLLPTNTSSYPYSPYTATNWPLGMQVVGGASAPVLAMGMGNPLEPGSYYIGVIDSYSWHDPIHYTLQSRGIGPGHSLPVQDLNLANGAASVNLPAAEAGYYRVMVPSNTPDWKLRLTLAQGEASLKVQKDFLPFFINNESTSGWGAVFGGQGGQAMVHPGDEQWLLLPLSGRNAVEPGTYYVSVVGQSPSAALPALGTLSSLIEPVINAPATLAPGADILLTNSQACGELKLYRFTVPAGLAAFEVRLDNASGQSMLYLNAGTAAVGTWQWDYWHSSGSSQEPYGNFGGTNALWRDPGILTVPNPNPGLYQLTVNALPPTYSTCAGASYVVRIRATAAAASLSASPELNGPGLTNVAAGVLADGQRAFYRVTVPAAVGPAPVLGWKLELDAQSGTPSMRVRAGLLPDDLAGGATPYSSLSETVVPPFLTPGTWYLEVKGSGATSYSLTSTLLTTNNLKHPLWSMPALGQTTTAPGLTLPVIGDSGITAAGSALPGDQGTDLAQGKFDFYAVWVPTNNAGLLRTELQAISGTPTLYARVGAAPTLSHAPEGTNSGSVYDRALLGSATKYGNWVPLQGRYETQLPPGLWVIGVQAAGNANARYRLRLSCGNPVPGGLVQDLSLHGGSLTDQRLSGGDWRYYRVAIPSNAPANWVVTWSRSVGEAMLFVRDLVPPGEGTAYNPSTYPNGARDLHDWSTDYKNQGPYPCGLAPGTTTFTTPPLRPGSVYFLGFWSPSDTTFALSTATNGPVLAVTNTIPFFGGSLATTIPAHGSALYRLDAPPQATRLKFDCANPASLLLALEQGTLAQAGGNAHWSSWAQANANCDQALSSDTNSSPWPWLPGCSYYLAVSNTAATAQTLSLNTPVPADLSPVSFTAPPTVNATLLYPVVQVVYCVTNRGAGTASGGWYDLVWVSTNGVLDAQSQAGGYFYIDRAVPAGGAYWITNSLVLPRTTGVVHYTLFLQVNGGWTTLSESNGANNVSPGVAVTVTSTPPDLAPIALLAPPSVAGAPYPSVSLAWGVTNQGVGAASGAWSDALYLSTRPTLDGTETLIHSFTETNLVPAGAAYWRTNTVRVPVGQSGTYYLLLSVNDQDDLYEGNPANNVMAVPVTFNLSPPPDLAALRLSAPAMITNRNFSVAWAVTNQGTGPTAGPWQDRVYLAGKPDLSTGYSFSAGFAEIGPIAPGGSYTRTNVVSLSGVANGSYFLVFGANADSGQYEEVTTNNLLAVPLTVMLPAPPPNLQITGWGFSPSATVGATANFSVTATSDSPMSYQWFKDGVALVDNARISGATTAALRITNLLISDSGRYSVVVTIAAGSLSSVDMVMQVRQPLLLTALPQDQTYVAGGTVSFSVTVSGGAPPYTYQWSHDGVPLSNSSRISGATGSTLTLQNLVTSDLGTYSVLVQDSTSSQTQVSAQLQTAAKPTILTQPRSQSVYVGQSTYFSVFGTGAGTITYQWRKNNLPLANQTNSYFSIGSVQLSDAGAYTAVLSNAIGSVASQVATLTVTVRTNLPTDAKVLWARQAGGTGYDQAEALALDGAGNVLVAGSVNGDLDLPAEPVQFGTNSLAATGAQQFFVAKYQPQGTCLWVKTASGPANSQATAVAVDSQNNVLVAGTFSGSATFGSKTLTAFNGMDAFLAKLDANGQYLWAVAAGRTNGWGDAYTVCDAQGNVYWASTFEGTLRAASTTLTSRGLQDLFLSKLNASGVAQWATNFGAASTQLGVSSLALHSTGSGSAELFLAGGFYGSVTFGSTPLSSLGEQDVFLAKLNGSGAVQWALQAGGSGWNSAPVVAVDTQGRSFLAGGCSALSFATGTLSVTNTTSDFGYLLQVNPNGAPLWLRKAIRTGGVRAVAVNDQDQPLIGGWVGLPHNDADVLLERFDGAGNLLEQAFAGGAGYDGALALAPAQGESLYVAGGFQTTAAFGTNRLTSLGQDDLFLAKLSALNRPHTLAIHRLDLTSPTNLRLTFGYSDHLPVEEDLAAALRVLAGDLAMPRASWQVLTNIVPTPIGELQLDDPNTTAPRRFYQLQLAP